MHPSRLFAALLLTALGPGALAGQATVTPISGVVQVQSEDGKVTSVDTTRSVPPGASVRTGPDGRALLKMADGSEAVLRPGSTVTIEAADGGLRVLLGRVLLRISKLFRSGQERAYRTPTTVAAVRGTDFGLAVEASGATRVFVFDGVVDVSNVQLPDSTVAVRAGFVSAVSPGRAPATPRTFSASEWEGATGGDALERGEDRLVETTQAAVSARYLAFADPDIDALANPAYLATGPAGRLTSLAAAWGYRGSSTVTDGGTTTRVSDDRGGEALTQHLAVVPAGGIRVGAYVQGDLGTDRGVRDIRPATATEAQRTFQDQSWSLGEGRLMASGGLGANGAWGWGAAAGYHRWSSDMDQRPATSTGLFGHTEDGTTVTTAQVGLLRHGSGGSTLSFGYRYLRSQEDVTAPDSVENFQGRTHTLDVLARGVRGSTLWGSWLQVERSTVDETLDDATGRRVYVETGSLWSAKGGVGIGLQPTSGVVLGADAAVGIAPERAEQRHPDGSLIESEKDLRLSGGLHVGGQITISGPWRFDVSVLHGFQRLRRDFTFPAFMVPVSRTVNDTRTNYGTHARLGLLYVGERLAGGYLLRSAPEAGRPPLHTLLLVARVW